MAWFDIAAGLAQGAQQGIDRVQADQVRRKADAFKDAQEKRALAAEARVAQQARNEQLDAELARQDPDNIDPAVVSQMTPEEMRSRIRQVKGPDGKPIAQLRESPGAALERKNKALVAGEVAPKIAEEQTNRATRVVTAKELLAMDQTWNSGKALTDADVLRLGGALKKEPGEINERLSAKARARAREMMPGVAAAETQLRGTLAAQAIAERNATLREETRLAIETLKDNRATAATKQAAVARYLTAAKDLEPAEREAGLNQMLSIAFGESPTSPSTAVTPEQDKMTNDLLKKYGG